MDTGPLNLSLEDKVHGVSLVTLLALVLVSSGLVTGRAIDHLSEAYAAREIQEQVQH